MEIIRGRAELVVAAALMWAHAVAARDGYAEVPALAEARPGVENALADEPSLFLLALEGGVPVGFLAVVHSGQMITLASTTSVCARTRRARVSGRRR